MNLSGMPGSLFVRIVRGNDAYCLCPLKVYTQPEFAGKAVFVTRAFDVE